MPGAALEPRFPVAGGCQCGAVRYTLHGPAHEVYHCHCQMCRKVHGAVFVTFAVVDRRLLNVDKGEEALAVFDSSPGTHRYFCRHCGGQLFCDVDSRQGIRYFTPATLDGGAHPGFPPDSERHIYVGSKVPWYRIADDVPQFDVT